MAKTFTEVLFTKGFKSEIFLSNLCRKAAIGRKIECKQSCAETFFSAEIPFVNPNLRENPFRESGPWIIIFVR